MGKKLFGVKLLFLLILITTLIHSYQKYTFNTFGISFYYPDNWELKDVLSSSVSFSWGTAMENGNLFVSISTSEDRFDSPYTDVEDKIKRVLSSDSLAVVSIAKISKIEIEGHWGYDIEYSTKYSDNPYIFYDRLVVFRIPHINKKMVLTYVTSGDYPISKKNSDMVELSELFSSIKILNNTTVNRSTFSNTFVTPDSLIISYPDNISASYGQNLYSPFNLRNKKKTLNVIDTFDRVINDIYVAIYDTVVMNWQSYAISEFNYYILKNGRNVEIIDSTITGKNASILCYYSDPPVRYFKYLYYENFGGKVLQLSASGAYYALQAYSSFYDSLLNHIGYAINASSKRAPSSFNNNSRIGNSGSNSEFFNLLGQKQTLLNRSPNLQSPLLLIHMLNNSYNKKLKIQK